MASPVKMFVHKHGTARLTRVKQRTESALLERIDRLLSLLDNDDGRVLSRRMERAKAKALKVFREDMRRYFEILREIDGRQTCESIAECQQEDAEAQGGGGQSLLGQLGMALFALKASNAFDDLAKLSGRKK